MIQEQDWKINLLKKSQKLKFYNNLLLHNNEKKFTKNNHFDLVFSNSAYWVKNIKQTFDRYKQKQNKMDIYIYKLNLETLIYLL